MLDTNIASHVIRGDLPAVRQRVLMVPMESLVISSVTEAELRYGVAKRGYPKALTQAVDLFLERVETLAWSSDVATVYANLRTSGEKAGNSLSALDMMIASHAKATDAILVTRDKAFRAKALELNLEDWSEDSH
jgi:tRNA(fMet)-specific endonuclease VapC